ncbi:MAG: glutathione S-transferase family protein [Caulobacterales bacterium]|nr:glutathione S-transferase family protein [Caulobacterales bacterium]
MSNPVPTLFFAPKSCAIASLGALEAVGAPFSAAPVTMAPDGAGDAPFRRLNPRRQVPVLEIDGRIVRETGAILQALDARHPEARLLPSGPSARIAALEWLGHLGGSVHPAFRLIFRPARFVGEDPQAQSALRAATREELSRLFSGLANDLAERDWLLGEWSALDFYLFVFERWAGLISLDVAPNLRAHHDRVAALPAMCRALEREAAASAP